MKKQISLSIVFSLLLSQFSGFAEAAQGPAQMRLDEIDAQYQKQLQGIQNERMQQLVALRLDYETALKFIDAQLADAQHNLVAEYQPQLAQANAAKAVSLRLAMQKKSAAARREYQKAVKALKAQREKATKSIDDAVQDARQLLRNKRDTFKRGAKGSAAAVDSAVSAFAQFGSSFGNTLKKSVNNAGQSFKQVQQNYANALKNAGLIMIGAAAGGVVGAAAMSPQVRKYVGGKMRTVAGQVANRAQAMGDSLRANWSKITAGLNQGKNKLISQITALNTQGKSIADTVKALGSRPMAAAERKAFDIQLNSFAKNIAALSLIGPVPAVTYHTAAQSSLAQRVYAEGKKKLMAPIQKVAASWRNFKVKMNCLGNQACTLEQRKEASKAFLKVYFTVYGLFVVAVYGTLLAMLISEEMHMAKEQAGVAQRQAAMDGAWAQSKAAMDEVSGRPVAPLDPFVMPKSQQPRERAPELTPRTPRPYRYGGQPAVPGEKGEIELEVGEWKGTNPFYTDDMN